MKSYNEIENTVKAAEYRLELALRAAGHYLYTSRSYERRGVHARNLVIDHAGHESWQVYFVRTGDIPNEFEWRMMSSTRRHQYTVKWVRHMLITAHIHKRWYFGTAAWITTRAILAQRIRSGHDLNRKILLPRHRKNLEQFLKM